MSKLYSESTRGFYDEFDSPDIPEDAVVIADDLYQTLLESQSLGYEIVPGAEGYPEAKAPAPPTFAQRAALLEQAVERHIDETAKSLGYKNIDTAVSYAEEPAVPKFQQEGRALRAWRSKVWAFCHTLLAEVTGGEKDEPSEAELLAMLPVLGV